MGRQKNQNLKPIAYKKDKSGSQKTKKRKNEAEDDAKLAITASKFSKYQPTEKKADSTPTTTTFSEEIQPTDIAGPNSSNSDLQEDTTGATSLTLIPLLPADVAEIPAETFDSSDPSTWPNPLTASVKLTLLKNGARQEVLSEYPKIGKFSFNAKQFLKTFKNQKSVNRDWLVYSKKTNSLFCFACCLFTAIGSGANSPWSNFGPESVGFSDFRHQSRAICLHEESQQHFQAAINWKDYNTRNEAGKLINQSSQENHEKQLTHWKQILRCMIDAVVFLANNNLAFRGTSSAIQDRNCGNFLSLIKLLSRYHAPLALHVNRLEKGKVNYMSYKTQNEFISIAASNVRTSILSNIYTRKYFSILFDATPDVSHMEQISHVIRTVNVSNLGCCVEENFLGFIHYDKKTGLITQTILDALKKDGLDIQNCRGQGYDNGSNMAGVYNGVQARIKEINSSAEFVPSAAHSLNLVGQNSASKIIEGRLILGQIQNLFCFFSASPSRWTTLKKYVKKTLKSQSSTRWSSRADAVSVLYEEFDGVCEALVELINSNDANVQTVADANSYFNLIYNLKFLLGLVVWNFILGRIHIASLALQQIGSDIDQASKHLEGLVSWLITFQEEGYEKSLNTARKMAIDLGIPEDSGFDFRKTRGIRPAKYRDSILISKGDNEVEKFKAEFFDAIMKTLLTEFESRFKQIRQTSDYFSFLWGTNLSRGNTEQLCKAAKNLSMKYPADMEASVFIKEMEYFKSAVTPFLKDGKQLSDTDALEMLNILTCNSLQVQFINCHTALRLFLTIPVTVATNERSFSKLKLIKNHLRSSMGQERLSDLAILSIESEYVDRMSFDKIIDDFATAKCRRVII